MVYLNGGWLPAEQAKISVFDRGFLFADGIYEVIPAYHQRLFRLEEHLQRLDNSLDALGISNPNSHAEWAEVLNTLVQKNSAAGKNVAVYLQITRGSSGKRDHSLSKDASPTVFACINPMSDIPAHIFEKGVSAITLPDIRWLRCDIKSVSLLPNILMKQQADAAGANEAILLRDGIVTEGATSNLFIVSNGVVSTPAKSEEILPGVTRDLVIELAQANGLTVHENAISEDQLRGADEIWISSSTRELYPVCALDNNPVGTGQPGPVWQQTFASIQDFKANWHG